MAKKKIEAELQGIKHKEIKMIITTLTFKFKLFKNPYKLQKR